MDYYFNGRDPLQIMMGVIQLGWALLIMPGVHLGSMGWLGSTLSPDAPIVIVLLMMAGGITLMASNPDNRYLLVGLIPVSLYAVVSTLAYLSGETPIPPVAILQTSILPILGIVHGFTRARIESIVWANIKREMKK